MKKKIVSLLITLLLIATGLFTTTNTLADWDEGDEHKMHFPQLPDPTGWDVIAEYYQEDEKGYILADDWRCRETGPVTDIHFWGSWLDDKKGEIEGFYIAIHSNIPEDPDIPYSRPGKTLWERYITNFQVREYESPGQGFYWPQFQEYEPNDHKMYYQYNIVDIKEPFQQKEGTIYWLAVSPQVKQVPPGENQPFWGWKTSKDHWEDNACWSEWGTLQWQELYEPPEFERPLDLAFVITGQKEECICTLNVDIQSGIYQTAIPVIIKNIGNTTCPDIDWVISSTALFGSASCNQNGNIPLLLPSDSQTVNCTAGGGFSIIKLTAKATACEQTFIDETYALIFVFGAFPFIYVL
ncbi:MAG: hypothetical protein V5A68_07005 [Candidatus Thermoplasmatota archaeon]